MAATESSWLRRLVSRRSTRESALGRRVLLFEVGDGFFQLIYRFVGRGFFTSQLHVAGLVVGFGAQRAAGSVRRGFLRFQGSLQAADDFQQLFQVLIGRGFLLG